MSKLSEEVIKKIKSMTETNSIIGKARHIGISAKVKESKLTEKSDVVLVVFTRKPSSYKDLSSKGYKAS